MTGRGRIAALAALALMACAVAACEQEPVFHGAAFDPPAPAPDITGTNWNGEPFRLSDERGRVAVIFFGYTSCPDICPFTLAKLRGLHERLGDRADRLSVVFVSVDPERDTQEKLARYVPSFEPDFYGLRVEGEALEALTRSYGVAVVEGEREGDFYAVDHTARLWVVDHEGRLRLGIHQDASLDEIAHDVGALLERAPANPPAPRLRVVDPVSHPTAGADVAAVYLTIVNEGDRADRLTGAASPAAERASLHESVQDGDRVRMRPVDGVEIPPGGRVSLAPGGLHVMLMGLTRPLAVGDTLELRLEFDRTGPLDLAVPVRRRSP